MMEEALSVVVSFWYAWAYYVRYFCVIDKLECGMYHVLSIKNVPSRVMLGGCGSCFASGR